MTPSSVNPSECRIGVGDATIALLCPSAEYAASLREYFATGVVDGDPDREPDLQIELEVVPHDDQPAIPDSLFSTKRMDGDRFIIDNGLVTGSFRAAERRGEIKVKGILTKEPLTRVFEQLLYQAFYSARRLRGDEAALIHASGVIRNGAGYLFVGESGAGKSTVAALSGDTPGQVLNDEICLVQFGAEGPILHSTPFNGLFRDKESGSAPLRAVFLLQHGPDHRIEPINPAFAIALLTGQVVAPLPLEEALSPATSQAMLDVAARLAEAAPVRRLLFTPDPGFWPVILAESFAQEKQA